MAIDIDTWRDSPYSSFLIFCTKQTLSELRRHWMLYENVEDLPPKERENLKELFVKGKRSALAKFGDMTVIGRSAAGPLWAEACGLGAEHFKHYWKTGITSDDKKQVAAATFLNPTFAYSMSGRGFTLHYGTDPILAFHLAETFAPTKSSRNNAVSIGDLAESVKSQFYTWCSAFHARVTSESVIPTIVIRIFTGDALAFSRALHHCAQNRSIESGAFVSAWGGSQIVLDGGGYEQISTDSYHAPLFYDVIDTSNLTDHVGLLNILIACLPLLQKTSSAVLQTNYLLPMHSTLPNKLEERICADLATLSLLFGVVPTSYVSDFTTQSNTLESVLLDTIVNTLHEAVSWKRLPLTNYNSAQSLVYEPRQLGAFLFDIYLKMFSDEKLPDMSSLPKIEMLQRQSTQHYVRATFVALLQLIRSRVSTNWAQAMQHLVDLIGNDRTLLVGLNYYQDLMCQLHIRGVYSVDALLLSVPHKPGGEDFFQGWSTIPPVICIVLRVPRAALKVVEEMDPDNIGTPMLHCGLIGPGFQNSFSSIQFFFGNITASDVGLQGTLAVEEDLSRWNGISPLVASFHVPSWILNHNPSRTRVTLDVRSTPHTAKYLLPKLGLAMCIFSAPLMDSQHVFAVRERPNNGMELKNLSNATLHLRSNPGTPTNPVTVRLENHGGHKVSGFTARANIIEAGGRAALTKKESVAMKQVSPYAMLASFGPYEKTITFPFPIDSTNYKLRIARKSFYVEVREILFVSFSITQDSIAQVDVAIATPRSPFGLTLDPYPVLMDDSKPNLWNIHYLNLSRLPPLDLSSLKRLQFLHTHVGLAFSDRERGTSSSESQDVIVDVKESITVILLHFSGLVTPRSRVFGLTDLSDGGIYAFVFVNDLRLDLPANTVVADACVLPLTHVLFSKKSVQDALKNFSTKQNMMQVRTAGKEVKAWKQLLPVLAERCREWTHTANCEYIEMGVPLSTEFGQSPLCSCGKGKAVPPSFMKGEWKALAPLVTRIALSPLFAVSYLEEIGNKLKQNVTNVLDQKGKKTTWASSNVCAKCGGHGKPSLMKCSRCRNVEYCSKACQTEDWKAHKIQCQSEGQA